jgi:ATP-binding cassette subfamily B protein
LPKPQSESVFRRLLPYLKPHSRAIFIGLACLLVAVPAGAFHPLVWGYMVDEVIGKRRVNMLLAAVGVMLAVQVIDTVLEGYRDNLLQKVGQRLVFDLRNQVYDKLQRQSLSYLHDNRVGDLVARAMGDIDVIQEVAVQGTDTIISNLLSFVYVAIILLLLSWKLGIVTLMPIVLVFVLTRHFNIRVKKLYRDARDRLGAVNARLQENLQGMVLIKAFAKEREESARFRATSQDYLQTSFQAINARTTFFPAVRFVGFFSNLLSLGFGAWLVLQGEFTVGGLIAYRGYWWPLFQPINSLATINEMLQRAQAAGSRVFELLDGEEAIQDAPDALPLCLTAGQVSFEGVSFAYEAKPILEDISFIAEPGEMVALVGPSGAGKTTVMNLIPRFYEPQAGVIRIDGQPIASVTQRSLRGHMAMVLQETFLFNGTVLENLRYGNPGATREQLEEAVRSANATDFIAALPNGLETEIGERGIKLSGGQRQRLSIARAFLADPAILLLDEPTSSVEPESEAIITQALERLMRGRTTFVTSHRFSLVRGADRILVFEQGRLVEQGRHADLLQSGGLYAAMYRQQMGE